MPAGRGVFDTATRGGTWLGLRVALIDGRVLDVRRGQTIDFEVPALPLPQTTKHSAGYRLAPGMDWIDLFVGSEGTLGVVLSADLQLLPAPKELLTGVIFFGDDGAALDAVDQWRSVANLRMLEYLDRASLAMLDVKAGAALVIEQEIVSGAEDEEWIERLEHAGALLDDSWFAANDADRERFRRFRHSLPERVNETVRRNGFMKVGSDYAVPIDTNRAMLEVYRRALDREFPEQAVVFGHIGDAHVHVNILPRSQPEFERAGALMVEFAREAVRLGGTVGAEHGLGKRKRHLLGLQYSAAEIEAMKSVKRRLDPQWLLGRGTLFPC